MRDSMVFYRSFLNAVKGLPPDMFKEAVTALLEYAMDDKIPESTGIGRTIYEMSKPIIDRNNQKYKNGKQGGRPSNQTEPNNNQMETNQEPTDNQTEPNRNQSITKNRAKSDNQTETKAKPNQNQTITKTEPNQSQIEPNDNLYDKCNMLDVDIKNKNNITHVCAHAREVMVISELAEFPNKDEAIQLWETVKSILEQEVHSLGFDVWIKPLRALGFMDNVLVVAAPSVKSADEVVNKYVDTINSILRRINK